MTTFTDEDKELIKEIRERIGSLDVRDNIERRAYEIALASLEAEPVAYIFKHPAGKLFWALTDESNKEQPDVIPVYADSPAPVVPEEMYWQDAPVEGSSKAAAYATGWNACRAAMLHSAEPVSQAYKLNALDGNSPVTPDGWISCSERMPPQDDWILIYSKHGEYMAGQVQGEYVELSDGTLSWLGNALFWMPLPEPPQEAK
ncbi:DUF551 domain-containing protein [Escherichia coli]|uniref:DUF551 domain-containing protein n=1 Tax=Escherichia coli TaxID=562 RepID=UPI003F58A8D1